MIWLLSQTNKKGNTMTTTKDKVNYSDMWKFAWNSYKGIGGYLNPDKYYLDKHPRESDDKYASRQNIAFYVNIYNQKVERYCGYLYRTTPLRTTNNSLINFDVGKAQIYLRNELFIIHS